MWACSSSFLYSRLQCQSCGSRSFALPARIWSAIYHWLSFNVRQSWLCPLGHQISSQPAPLSLPCYLLVIPNARWIFPPSIGNILSYLSEDKEEPVRWGWGFPPRTLPAASCCLWWVQHHLLGCARRRGAGFWEATSGCRWPHDNSTETAGVRTVWGNLCHALHLLWNRGPLTDALGNCISRKLSIQLPRSLRSCLRPSLRPGPRSTLWAPSVQYMRTHLPKLPDNFFLKLEDK